jgi:exonuclease SbcC
MIPVRLELHNFMAYRDPEPLKFEGIQLACLVGENGAGKSTLLDAITWALWGQARARRDDELFHLGGGVKDMYVTFDFDLDGTLYRVRRQRERTKRASKGTLDFFISDGAQWRSLSEDNTRATQDKITHVLKLDYDTFINSSLLLQGRADEFTTKRPADRKAVLSSILGLDVWATFEDRAKAAAREHRQNLEMIERQLVEIDKELGREAEYREALVGAQQQALDATNALRDAEAKHRELDAAQQQRLAAQTRLDDLEGRVKQHRAELDRAEADIARQDERLAAFRAVLDERSAIEQGHAAWLEARRREQDFGARLQAHAELAERRAKLEQQVQAARGQLEGDLRLLVQRAEDAERAAAAGEEAARALQDVAAEIEALGAVGDTLDALRDQSDTLKEERAALQSENRQLKAEMDELADRLDRLQASDEPTCPLCGQDLSEAHRARMIAQLSDDHAGKRERQGANAGRMNAIAAALNANQRDVKAAEAEQSKLPALNGEKARLEAQVKAAGEAGEALATLAAERDALETRLAQGDYAPDAHAALAGVAAEIEALGYDRDGHDAARAEVTQLARFEEQKQSLDSAAAGEQEAGAQLAEAKQRREDWQARLAEDQQSADDARAEIAALDAVLEGVEDHEARLDALRKAQIQANEALGRAQQVVNVLEDKRKRKGELQAEHAAHTEALAVYRELQRAFGKNGVPTMVIESVIPDIQDAANQLLGRLTNGSMHLRFETQRAKVSGEGAIETLDIIIGDDKGDRDYEMYSGGEAFRVNFAIRIALSRLLARRAGAQLRTLIIDEGFGSQDATGRDRLVEAINAIKSDFECIIVITHIEELKDLFPARIEVTKTENGSTISIL